MRDFMKVFVVYFYTRVIVAEAIGRNDTVQLMFRPVSFCMMRFIIQSLTSFHETKHDFLAIRTLCKHYDRSKH